MWTRWIPTGGLGDYTDPEQSSIGFVSTIPSIVYQRWRREWGTEKANKKMATQEKNIYPLKKITIQHLYMLRHSVHWVRSLWTHSYPFGWFVDCVFLAPGGSIEIGLKAVFVWFLFEIVSHMVFFPVKPTSHGVLAPFENCKTVLCGLLHCVCLVVVVVGDCWNWNFW